MKEQSSNKAGGAKKGPHNPENSETSVKLRRKVGHNQPLDWKSVRCYP